MKTNNPWNTSPSGGHSQKNPSDEADSHHPLFFKRFWNGLWQWELLQGEAKCESIWNCFFDLLFVAFVITMIYNDLPQRTLTPSLTVALKHICSWQRDNLTLSTCEKKKLKHLFPEAGLEMFCKTEDLFILLPQCLSSILPFEFTSLLLLSVSLRQLGIQILIR